MHNWSSDDIGQLPKDFRTKLINGVTGFRAALLVGTADLEGRSNLAIFSNIFHIGADPALVGLIIRPNPAGSERHTLDNILATEAFTLNHFPVNHAARAHQTSARYPKGHSEFAASDFTERWLDGFAAPFVEGCTVQLGLTLVEHQSLNINGTHLIIGALAHIHCPKEVIREDGSVNLVGADSTVACGLDSYHRVLPGERFAYAKADLPPRRLD